MYLNLILSTQNIKSYNLNWCQLHIKQPKAVARNVCFWVWGNLFYDMFSSLFSSHISFWLYIPNSWIFGETDFKQRKSIPCFSNKSLFRWYISPEIHITEPKYVFFSEKKKQPKKKKRETIISLAIAPLPSKSSRHMSCRNPFVYISFCPLK